MESGLLRQRRNLIFISSVLIVYDFAQIKINQVTWMGTSIEVGNPAALSFIVWVVWLYFLLRYYQYWSSEKDTLVLNDLNSLTRDRAISYCKARYELPKDYGWDGGLALKRKNFFKWALEKSKYESRRGSYVEDAFDVPVARLMWYSLVELSGYCVHKKHMSDHVLPFFLAISAFLVKAYSLLRLA